MAAQETAASRVKDLRTHLSKVQTAYAETTLDAIRAYETALGAGPGEGTTFWNGFNRQELEAMRKLAHTRLSSLELNLKNIPPEHVPPSLEFRFREVRGWLKSLDSEVSRRYSHRELVQPK